MIHPVFIAALAIAATGDSDEAPANTEAKPVDTAAEGEAPAAAERVAVEGDSPGYRDIRVSDRSPNMNGQTGIWRVTSAKTGEGGYFDIGLHGRYFYGEDFIVANSTDQVTYGNLTFGVTFNEYLELSLSGLISANENSAMNPRTTFSTGDLAANIKAAFPIWVLAFGLDARVFFPSGQDRIGPEVDNFGAQAMGLATVDLWQELGWPFRLHLNGGYVYQNRGSDPNRLLKGRVGHLLALTFEYSYYDRIAYGVGAEVPLPYVTPFVEVTGEYPMAPGMSFTNAPLRVTPGVRITPGRGLAFDLGGDIRILGGDPVEGVATPTPWMIHAGMSYNFSPFVAETRVEVREKIIKVEKPLGFVAGRVLDAHSGEPVPEAFLTFVTATGPRIVADAEGRYRSYGLVPGAVTVAANHPEYKSGEGQTVIAAQQTAALDIKLVPEPRLGVLKGVIVDEKDASVPATMEISSADGEVATYEQPGGSYRVELAPGRHQVVIKAVGYLQQGRSVTIENRRQTIEDFILKKEPKRRVTILKRDRIEIKSTIHFEFNKARILSNSFHILDEVVDIMLKNTHVERVRVEGHTDNVGNDSYNKKLSASRAKAVIEYLVAHGISSERLQAIGFGEEKPISTNRTNKGRAMNRRVEFNIVDKESADQEASEDDTSGTDDESATGAGDGEATQPDLVLPEGE